MSAVSTSTGSGSSSPVEPAQLRHDLEAVGRGHVQVEQDEVGVDAAAHRATASDDSVVVQDLGHAPLTQEGLEREHVRLVVVDDHEPCVCEDVSVHRETERYARVIVGASPCSSPSAPDTPSRRPPSRSRARCGPGELRRGDKLPPERELAVDGDQPPDAARGGADPRRRRRARGAPRPGRRDVRRGRRRAGRARPRALGRCAWRRSPTCSRRGGSSSPASRGSRRSGRPTRSSTAGALDRRDARDLRARLRRRATRSASSSSTCSSTSRSRARPGNPTVAALMRSLLRQLEIARDMAMHLPLVPGVDDGDPRAHAGGRPVGRPRTGVRGHGRALGPTGANRRK